MSKKTAPDTGATERAAERGEPIYERLLPARFLVARRPGRPGDGPLSQPALPGPHGRAGRPDLDAV